MLNQSVLNGFAVSIKAQSNTAELFSLDTAHEISLHVPEGSFGGWEAPDHTPVNSLLST